MKTLEIPLGTKIAFIHRPERCSEYAYAEALLVNRGFIARVFTRIADAEEWLRTTPACGN